ncbi:MAG TPA: acetyl-CoA carboxylase biotin carboxyl carrier protein [Phycisphaerae bacterium]|nr:acetyl-CoA carboxylase biotin carboxyl carrier protein [Phycisphaerae bacterium]HNU43846.1 acetyl-CoA carboxylase biotin carboxyl carrier protein [Phycisphaerae bacterium]
MLDIDKIRQLIQMMLENDLAELSLRDGEEEVNLRRANPTAAVETLRLPNGVPTVPIIAPGPVPAAPPPAPAPPPPPEEKKLIPISSPMVGTFYASSAPDALPYVSTGSVVEPETVVCVLEAMKVFNEIKADVEGTIETILVKNEQAVEYGQPLFLVRPA